MSSRKFTGFQNETGAAIRQS